MTAGKYFNRAVMALDAPHIGFVVRDTPDKIVVFVSNISAVSFKYSLLTNFANNTLGNNNR